MKSCIKKILDNPVVNFFILTLALISFISVTLEIIFLKEFDILVKLEIFILAIFTIEFILQIYISESNIEYILEGEGLVDLLSIASGLTFIQGLTTIKIIKTFRAIRLFKFFKEIPGKGLNAIILLQVTLSLIISILVLNTCSLKEDSHFKNINQILYLIVVLLIFATAIIVKIVSKHNKTE